jgi:hypothetical protein
MTRKCTNPERWKVIPASDASEHEVEAYLTHTRECVFHAEAEMRHLRMVSTIAAIAGCRSWDGHPFLTTEEAERIRASLNQLKKTAFMSPLRMLSVRVNGTEKARIDLRQDNKIKLDVNDPALIGVWVPNEDREEEDQYLTTYILPKTNEIPKGKEKSSVTLENGEIISFEVESKGELGARITVAYRKANLLRALQFTPRRMLNGFRTALGQVNREWSPGRAITILAIVVITIIAASRLPNTNEPGQTAEQGERRQQKVEQDHTSGPSVQRSEPGPQDSMARQMDSTNPRLTPSPMRIDRERKAKNLVAGKNAATASTVYLRSIYVSNGFAPEFRQAINSSLQARGVTTVESEEAASAVLRAEPTRSEEIVVELISGSHKRLWWMKAKTSGDRSAIEELAKKIADDLFKNIESLRRNEARSPQR